MDRIDQIRKTWLQGSFESAEEQFLIEELEVPIREFELMLLYLFWGKFDRYEKIEEKLLQYELSGKERIIELILTVHKYFVLGEITEQYELLLQQISPEVDTLDGDYYLFWKAIYYILSGVSVISIDPQQAIDVSKYALDVIDNCKDYYSSTYVTIAVHNNVGEYLRSTGDIDMALLHVQQAKEITIQSQLNIVMGEIYSQLGAIYFELQKYQQAIQHYNEGLKIPYLQNIPLYHAIYYFRLYNLHRKLDHKSQMNDIYHQIEQLQRTRDEAILTQTYRIMTADRLILQKRRQSTSQAEKILHELNEDADLYYEYKLLVRLRILDLLIQEWSQYENKEILQDIDQNLDELDQLAEEWNSTLLQLEILIMKAKLHLVQKNVEVAYAIFTQALEQATKQANTPAINQINEELEQLELQVKNWNSLAFQSESVADRIYQSKIKEYINIVVERLSNK